MKKSMKEYILKVDKMIKRKEVASIDEVINEHLIKISFYQHERLIHFLVTMLFAILTLVTFFYTLVSPTTLLLAMTLLLLCLLVPYIFHYYFLENDIQKMYKQYDRLKELKK